MSSELSAQARQLESLRAENARLREENAELEREIASLRQKGETDELRKSYEKEMQEMRERLRIAAEGQRERIEKCEEAQQVEKEHWVKKLQCLQEEKKKRDGEIDELRAAAEEQKRERSEAVGRLERDVDALQREQKDVLVAAGVYFHRIFKSADELRAFFSEQPEMARASERSRVEEESSRLSDENEALRAENENVRAKMADLEAEVSSLRSVSEELGRKRDTEMELRSRIAEQEKEIGSLVLDGPVALQVAKLKNENEKLRQKLKEATKEAKNRRPVTKVRETDPEILWGQVEGPEIPEELAETLSKIIENDSLQIPAKFKHVLKTICSYYELRQENLCSTSEKTKQKTAVLMRKLTMFCDTLALLMVQRTVTVRELAEDENLQNEILYNVKQLKTELKDALIENRRLQRTFPAEEVMRLKAKNKQQRKKLHAMKEEMIDLRRRVPPPEDDVMQLRKVLEETYEQKKQKKRHQSEKTKRHASEKAKRHPSEKAKGHLSRRYVSEEVHEEKRVRSVGDTAKYVTSEKREAIMTAPAVAPAPRVDPNPLPSDEQLVINELRRQIRSLQSDKDSLAAELEAIKLAFIEKMKNAKVQSITEYEDLVMRLKERVQAQRETIQALSVNA